MANYANLKAAVAAVVKSNGAQEITGANLQSTLLSIIDSLGANYTFAGVATPETDPGTPDQNVFYIGGAGTYTNFGGSYTINEGEIGIFTYNGVWLKEKLSLRTQNPIFTQENRYAGPNGTIVTPSSTTTWHCDFYRIENGIVVIKGIRNTGYSNPVYADVIFYSSENTFDGTTFLGRGINAASINEYEVPEGTRMMLVCRKEDSGITNDIIGYSAVIPSNIKNNSIQLCDASGFSVANTFIRPNGQPSTSETPNSWVSTPFISISEGDIISVYSSINSGAVGCFYDRLENPIKTFISDTNNQCIVQAPVGAKYMRICNSTNVIPNGYFANIIGKAEVPADYVPFIDASNFIIPNVFIRPNGQPSDGSTTNSWVCTDFIEVNDGDILSIYSSINSGAVGCFYNSEEEALKTFTSDINTNRCIVQAPVGAKYIRICNSTNVIPDGYYARIIGKSEIQPSQSGMQLYKSVIKKPFVFNSKTATFAGDSITYGFTSGSTNVHGTGDWPTLICNMLGMTGNNIAVGGALFTSGYNEVTTIVTQIQNANKNVDYLFIAGGINDWQMSVPLSTFKTTISNLCDYINQNYASNVNVIWITPINEAGWHSPGTAGTVQQYRDILTEVVMSKNVNFNFSIIEGNEMNFPTVNADSSFKTAMFGDNLHPTALGYKWYATSMLGFLL